MQEEQQAVQNLLPVSDHLDVRKQLEFTVQWAEKVQFDTVPLLQDMISALPERGFFRSFEFLSPNLATVVVQFDDKPEASHYYSRLAASESIEHVALESVTAETMDEEAFDVTHDVMPRYLATYSVTFVDQRNLTEQPVEESADELDIEGGGTDE